MYVCCGEGLMLEVKLESRRVVAVGDLVFCCFRGQRAGIYGATGVLRTATVERQKTVKYIVCLGMM